MPEAQTLAPIVASLDAILSAPEALNDRAPAAVAYRAAIRRHGRVLAEIGGPAAMHEALRRTADLAPERSARREAVIDAAWRDLPGWTDAA